MCEPLRDKVQFANWENPCFRCKDVKSAVAFYKKHYMGNPDELPKEHYREYKKWLNNKMNKAQTKSYLESFPIAQDWLFDYCFGDVIE